MIKYSVFCNSEKALEEMNLRGLESSGIAFCGLRLQFSSSIILNAVLTNISLTSRTALKILVKIINCYCLYLNDVYVCSAYLSILKQEQILF
jgi:hypothetical protein